MAGSNDFTGQNIQDTYQRVLQLSSSGQVADGTGSLVSFLPISASYAISASHEVTFEISSSFAETASYIENAQTASYVENAQTASFVSGLTGTNSGDVTLTGTPDYITISGQEITRNQIDLANDVTGILPSANLDADTAHLSTTQTFTGDKTFSGALTASEGLTVTGDISASGTNHTFGGTAFIGTTTNEAGAQSILTVGGESGTNIKIYSTHANTNRNVGLNISASENGQQYSIGLARERNTLYISPSRVGEGPSNAVFEIDAVGNITASSHISASGVISAPAYKIQGKDFANFANNTLQHGFDSSLVKYSYGKDSDNEHIFYGDITSSNNISASGDIITTNMTASGNISSSGGGLSVKNDIITGNGDVKLRGDKYVKFAEDAGFIIGSPATENFKIASGDDENDVFFSINRELGVAAITLTGNITASSNIKANGNISGSTIEGQTLISDVFLSAPSASITNLTTTNITASDNISGSTIEGQTLTADVFLSSPSASITNLTNTNITSSGNISASGVFAETLFLGSNIEHVGDLNTKMAFVNQNIKLVVNGSNFIECASSPSQKIILSKDISMPVGTILSGSTMEGQTLTADVFLSAPSASITNLTNTNITSSGNISASGAIYGNDFYQVNKQAIGDSDNGAKLDIGADPNWERISIGRDGTSLKLVGNITASGNISASGNIHGANFIIDEDISVRNISCSGQISASGNIFLHDGSFIARTQHNSLNSFKLKNTGLSHINIIGTEVDLVTMEGSTAVIGNPNEVESTPLHISGAGTKIHSISNITLDAANDVRFINDGFTYVSVKGDERRLEVVGDISASGNITGSTIEANTGSYHVLQGNTALPTGLDISGFLSATTITASDHISSSILESQTVTADVFLSSPSASITNLTNTNITSSGQISASGNITGNIINSQAYSIKSNTVIERNTNDVVLVGASEFTSIQIGKQNQLKPLRLEGDITASGNISGSLTSVLTIPEIQGRAIVGDQSGSLFLSGSLSFRANEPEPAVSASTLFVKATPTDNAPDTDLRFGNSGLTPAFAWVTLDDDANADSNEYGFGHDSAVTSNTHNMQVTHDESGDGVKIFSQIDGTYKVTGNYVVINGSTSTDVVYDINVDGSTVHTFSSRAHASVDPVERTQIYVGTVNSGSFIRTTVDGTGCQLKAGSVLLVERLA